MRRTGTFCLTAAAFGAFALTALKADVIVYDISVAAKMAASAGGGAGGGAGGNPGAAGAAEGAAPMPAAGGMGDMPAGAGGQIPGQPRPANVSLRITLQGDATVQGRLISYRHPSLKDSISFSMDVDPIEMIEAPTLLQQLNRRVGQAGKDPAALMAAAVWGLKKGLLKDFYATIDKVLAIDPKYEAAVRVLELKKKLDESLPENAAAENELKSIVQRPGMRVVSSKHYILLTDTPSKAEAGRRRNRADERLALLEQTHEVFLQFFTANGVNGLEVPHERLKAVLFNEYRDYHDFVSAANASSSGSSGFWDARRNVCVFHDGAAGEETAALENIHKGIKDVAEQARRQRGDPNLVRFAKAVELLVEVSRENASVRSVTRAATLQMAGSTGLLPRQVMVPQWVRDGLATYFESPIDAAWSGVGAVSDKRLASERTALPFDQIIGDQVAGSLPPAGGRSREGGPSWALTHYLFENRLPELITYYRMIGEMPADVVLGPDVLAQVFSRAFGGSPRQVELDWRNNMRTLKSDVDAIKETGKVTKSRSLQSNAATEGAM